MTIADNLTDLQPVAPISLISGPEDKEVGLNSCLFNIMVYSPAPARTPYLKGLIQCVIEHFPSRVLFAEANLQGSAPQTSIEFHCSAVRKGPYLTGYDEATIHFPMEKRAQIPFLVLPYLLPDLPVVLVWGQDPTTEQDILPHLMNVSNRLVYDSECAENLQRFSRRILTQADASRIDLVDLNWVRMKGWRDAFDEVFDSPARLEQLTLAQRVEISYNGRQDEFFQKAAIQTLYLQAWLASQLQWKLHHVELGNGIHRIFYHNGVNDTEVILKAENCNTMAPGSILGVNIVGGYDTQFSLAQKPGTQQATVHISSTETCELPFAVMISGPKLKYQFLKDIFYGGKSHHYLSTLQMLSQQDWKL